MERGQCRVRRAFRRTTRISIGNMCRMWCVQKTNAPYESDFDAVHLATIS